MIIEMTGVTNSSAFQKLEDDFKGIIDLFEMKAYIYNDEKGDNITVTDDLGDMADQAAEYRTELIEKICELDDDLMMQYLEGEEPSVDEMKKVLRKATCDCTAVPVCCGSAYRNKGVQKLLDAIIEYMPAPTDIPAIKGVDLDGNEVERHSSDDEPFAALAFKIMADPFVGKLAYFRVYSGTCKSGSYVLNATKDKKERVGRILQMHANKRQELDIVYSGDIAAAVGFKFTTTGDTICDEQHPVILESMEFPEPVIELAIEPKTKAGQGKLGEALAKLAEEDPTFRAHTDQETGQTIIAGMGDKPFVYGSPWSGKTPCYRNIKAPLGAIVKIERAQQNRMEKILFPIVVTIVVCMILPTTAPLVGMLMLGNLFREAGVVRQLQETASNALMYIVVIILGTSVGATTSAEAFLNAATLKIVALGLIAFAFGTAAGVLFGKLLCVATKGKVNPLIGSAFSHVSNS